MTHKKIFIALFTLLLSTGSVFAKEHFVEIKNFKFEPASLNIELGDMVTFVNNDTAPHSVVPAPENPNAFMPSQTLFQGEGFALELEVPGAALVKCGVHPGMPGMKISVLTRAEILIRDIQQKLIELNQVINK